MLSLSEAFRKFPADCKPVDIGSMQEVPESYVWSRDDLPTEDFGENKGIPIIDLQGLNWQLHEDTEKIRNITREIGSACEKWGFFQVINHGVSRKLMESMETHARRLFSLPFRQKLEALRAPDGLCGYGVARISSFFTKLLWSECFTSVGSPLEHAKKLWPHHHLQFCEEVEEYERAMKQMASKLMSIILRSAGLSLRDFEFMDLLASSSLSSCGALQINNYPACPQPFKTMGMPPHTDSTCLTILYQGGIDGLQINDNGKWITVPALPNALVVNLGDLLQILSNGRLKSALHRAVPNECRSRISVAYLWGPLSNAVVKPIPQLVDANHPRLYKSLTWSQYLSAKATHFDRALELFRYEHGSTVE